MSGRIVILNGAPRSGKSTIASALSTLLPGSWINLGVDAMNATLPPALLPGIGLRPGGERPDLEPDVVRLYGELYEEVATRSRSGGDVVVDVGHHDWYSRSLGILPAAARRLSGLPVVFVGVRCPIGTIMARRNADPMHAFGTYAHGEGVPEPVQRWQDAVHVPGIYDLEIDTSMVTPAEAVAAIAEVLAHPPNPTALERLLSI
jgi:chloramphenicol 3-O phosphotransferase